MKRGWPSGPRKGQNGNGALPMMLRSMLAAGALALAATHAGAASNSVRISSLSDVAFGTISNFGTDYVNAQSICVYSKSPPNNYYSITASGSGAGGAFLLSSGSDTLPYEVQWSATANQSVGTQLVANQALGLQQTASSSSSVDDCSKGPTSSASLIVILRSAALAAASSGTYSGTLTLLVAPQ